MAKTENRKPLSQIGDNSPPTPSDVAIEGEGELCLSTLISVVELLQGIGSEPGTEIGCRAPPSVLRPPVPCNSVSTVSCIFCSLLAASLCGCVIVL